MPRKCKVCGKTVHKKKGWFCSPHCKHENHKEKIASQLMEDLSKYTHRIVSRQVTSQKINSFTDKIAFKEQIQKDFTGAVGIVFTNNIKTKLKKNLNKDPFFCLNCNKQLTGQNKWQIIQTHTWTTDYTNTHKWKGAFCNEKCFHKYCEKLEYPPEPRPMTLMPPL